MKRLLCVLSFLAALAGVSYAQTSISISQLPYGGLLQPTDNVPAVRNGTTVKAIPFQTPPTGSVMISNGTSSPSGVAPITNYCLMGVNGAWTASQCIFPSTVTVTGSPVSGNLAGFAASNIIQATNLSGDVTTSGTAATVVGKINGVSLGSTTATAGNILVGSGTQWVTRAPSGDCSISSAGAFTCLNSNGVPIATTTGTQTLTNKSISGSEINSGTVAATYLPTGSSGALGVLQCGSGTSCSGGTISVPSSGVTSLTNSDGAIGLSASTGAITISATTATSSQLGVVKPDGTIITNTAGAITVAKASNSVFGVVEVDGTSITASSGVISAASSVTKSYIQGFIPTSQTFSSSTSATQTVTAGQAADSTNAVMLSGGSFSWSVANGNAINGYQGGTTLPNSSTIHFFVCKGTSGIASFASTSLTPTCPTNYNTYYRHIFSEITNSSGVLQAGSADEVAGGSLQYHYTAQLTDLSASACSASRTTYAIHVPTGINVQPYTNIFDSTSMAIHVSSYDGADLAPVVNTTTSDGWYNGAGGTASMYVRGDVLTDTSANLYIRCASTSNISIATDGFTDSRRE